MPNPILLNHKLGHLLILLRHHLQLDIFIFPNTSHFDLFTESLEYTIISGINRSFQFIDFSVNRIDRLGLGFEIWTEFLNFGSLGFELAFEI